MNTTQIEKTDEQIQAEFQLSHIRELMATYNAADDDARDEAQQMIYDSPLEITVSHGWHVLGTQPDKPEAFRILLCTGGPAVRISGEFDGNGEPENARIEYQGWGTPWTPCMVSEEDMVVLLEYCSALGVGC